MSMSAGGAGIARTGIQLQGGNGNGYLTINFSNNSPSFKVDGTYTYIAGNLQLLAATPIITSSNYIQFQNNNGYINFGPQNTSFAHIYTDRGQFAFNAHMCPSANATYDLGQTVTTPFYWRNIYFTGTAFGTASWASNVPAAGVNGTVANATNATNTVNINAGATVGSTYYPVMVGATSTNTAPIADSSNFTYNSTTHGLTVSQITASVGISGNHFGTSSYASASGQVICAIGSGYLIGVPSNSAGAQQIPLFSSAITFNNGRGSISANSFTSSNAFGFLGTASAAAYMGKTKVGNYASGNLIPTTVTFTTPFPTANYVVTFGYRSGSGAIYTTGNTVSGFTASGTTFAGDWGWVASYVGEY